ncbi:glycosyltransferase [Desulfacinum hydrothermale]|nr:glycosyltransferase [Desulfacinum hydrothermale]
MASLGHGGIGKIWTNLMAELVREGVRVDLLLGRMDSPYLDRVDPLVRVFHVKGSHALLSVPRLAWYLRQHHPQCLVTERIRVNVAALRARALACVKTRVYAGVHTNMSREIDNLRPEKRNKHASWFHHYYPRNDGFVAVSRGVADDLLKLLDVPRDRVKVVHNPVITPDIFKKAEAEPDHPWFKNPSLPIVLGVGRLEPQKDFPTLLHAFKIVSEKRPCRLVILGEGNQRASLEDLARRLHIDSHVSMPGHVDNPYAYMKRAALFVLSSRWEGFGNALVEAMAVGTPVVATDCPNGPREITQEGTAAPLVPVGNPQALASAMMNVMENPPDQDVLQRTVSCYTVEKMAPRYLEALGLSGK